MVKEINEKEFEENVKNGKGIVVVDFFATWCGPCRMLSPIMEDVSKDYTVYKVDVDKCENLAMEFGIMSIPCVVAFKDGKEYNRTLGLQPKDEIIKIIKG